MIGLVVDNYRNCVVTYCGMSVRSDVSSQASAFAGLGTFAHNSGLKNRFCDGDWKVLAMVLKENKSLYLDVDCI